MSLFSFWKPKCPLGFREKAWVETRMRWLGEQLGMTQLVRGKTILPTDEFFPDPYDATPETAARLFERVCDYMDVDRTGVELHVYTQDEMPQAAGLYQPGVVFLADAQLADPMALAAALSHELAHHAIIGRNLLKNERDFEWTADLAMTYYGLGIFGANATVSEAYERVGKYSSWSMSKQGYLPARMTAYAMALLEWIRGDARPDWIDHLRLDAANVFRDGIRYLEKTNDSLLRGDNLQRPDAISIDALIRQLEEGTASAKVAAFWELARYGSEADKAVPAILRCFSHAKASMRAEAVRALAAIGTTSEEVIMAIVEALGDWETEVRATAAFALGKLHVRPDIVIEPLTEAIGDRTTLENVSWSLAQFGAEALPALPKLLEKLQVELGRYTSAVDYLVYAVRAIAPDPESELRQLVEQCDLDLQRQAEHLIPEPGPIANPSGGDGWWIWTDALS